MKKNKHVKHCQERRSSSLFVLNADGVLGREDLGVLENFILLMAEKIDEPILHVCGCING